MQSQLGAYQSHDFGVVLQAGKTLYSTKAYANALQVFEKCNSIKPDDESVLNNICACYFNLARPDKVKQVYARILELHYKPNLNIESYLTSNNLNL